VDELAGLGMACVGWDAPTGDLAGTVEDLELGGGALGEEEGLEGVHRGISVEQNYRDMESRI